MTEPRQDRKTFTRYTIETEHRHEGATGEFSGLLNAVATAIKVVSNRVNRGTLGAAAAAPQAGSATGLDPASLDAVVNDVIIAETEWTGHLAAMTSQERDDIYPVPASYRRGKYLLVFDPLDGSGNIDVDTSVGTIFSILRSPRPGKDPRAEDFCQAGTEQVCAGFALYGPSTVLVLTTGEGVDGFTLDRDIGAFMLTHPQMRVPEQCSEFAINASNERFWEAPVRRYVRECLAGRTGPRGRDFNMRWVASLVTDAFRILVRGGVFLYPQDTRGPDEDGRLRLLHEVNPIAFVIEQAGGAASTGHERVMGLAPSRLHQRSPLIFGPRAEVDLIETYHREQPPDSPSETDFSLFGTRSLFRT